jgi:hypothetical protein
MFTISWGMISPSSPLGAMSFLVYFVCPVCLVYLVHLISFVQPKNQTNERDQLNPTTYSLYGGSRSSGSRRAGAPVALTLSQPGGRQPGGGSGWVAPVLCGHWVLRRESSPLSSQT